MYRLSASIVPSLTLLPTYYGNSSKAKKMKEDLMNKNLSESLRTSDQYFMDIQQISKIIREHVIDIWEHLMKL